MKRHSCPTPRSLGLLLLLVGLLACAAPSWGQSLNECGGYYVAYFNGVRTTFFNAVVGAKRLRELVAEDSTFTRCRPTGCVTEPIINGVFYNPSGGYLTDLKEVFQQRASEINRSGELERRLEYFWEVIAGGGRHLSFTDRLGTAVVQFLAVVNQIDQIRVTNVTAALTSILGDSDTQGVLAAHRAQLDDQAAQGRKMLLVAHSQGNLFVNEAHDYIEQEVGVASVEVVHIAPATRSLRGPHVLANIDLIINGFLRTHGPEGVPLATHHIPFSASDKLGHGLLETYLGRKRATRNAIESHMRSALNKLETPEDFPPPPTDLELVQTGDTGELFWERPLYELEPLRCDIPEYLVYRDDQEGPHGVEGEDRYYFDPDKSLVPRVCYEVTASLRDMTESDPTPPICSGVHVRLHIADYECRVTVRKRFDRNWTVTQTRITGTAEGPVGSLLVIGIMESSTSAYDGQSIRCPGWDQRAIHGRRSDEITLTQNYCIRMTQHPRATPFIYRQTSEVRLPRHAPLHMLILGGRGRPIHGPLLPWREAAAPRAEVNLGGPAGPKSCTLRDYTRATPPDTAKVTYAIED